MRIVKKLFPKQIIRQLSDKEFHVGANVIKNNLKLKPGEKVLIVTDHYKEKIEAAIFLKLLKNLLKTLN